MNVRASGVTDDLKLPLFRSVFIVVNDCVSANRFQRAVIHWTVLIMYLSDSPLTYTGHIIKMLLQSVRPIALHAMKEIRQYPSLTRNWTEQQAIIVRFPGNQVPHHPDSLCQAFTLASLSV
jgi:hypothetical protein